MNVIFESIDWYGNYRTCEEAGGTYLRECYFGTTKDLS